VAEVYGDFDVEMLICDADSPPPATPATPATPGESSRQNNDLETDSGSNDSATHCYPVATQLDQSAESSSRVAVSSSHPATQEAIDFIGIHEPSSRGSRGSSPPDAAICILPPCALCGESDRWDDHGILRCVACYPPGSMTLQRTMETLLACRRCGSMAAPVGDAPCPDGSVLMRCPDCQLPRMAIPPEERRDEV
jgi:hypothetical protein